MEYKDYYKILALARNATQDDVKRAYRKLARKFHPDINKDPGAEAQFKEIGEAYEVLSDAEKRAAYDQLGEQWRPGQEFRPPPNWDAGFEFSGAGSPDAAGQFSDFFSSLFGGMGRREPPRRGHTEFSLRGEDHHARILIDVRDALDGATRTISLRAPALDEGGHVVLRERTLNVTIPRGITQGQHIRIKGQGAPGIGRGDAGDLLLEVQLKKDPLYRVLGRDLYLDLPLAPWEAALGASVKVPTPQGPVMLKVPAGTAQGQELRIKGRGMPASEPGDLYAVIKIVLPAANTAHARQIYEDMARQLAFDPRANFGV
jgi:curved DNA-binding protein